MTPADAIAWGFATLALASALSVALSANILRSGFSLLLCLFALAGLYVLLGADLLAGIQVLLYVGGVVVLILFAILVTHRIGDAHVSNPSRNRPQAAAVSLSVFALLAGIAWTAFPPVPRAQATPTTARIGEALLTTHLFPFEAVSLLLLAALVGAAMMVRKEVRPESGETPGGGGWDG